MAACTNNGGSRARRAVTAALVGVLSVGTVPMAAVAAGTGTVDGVQTMATQDDEWQNGTFEFDHEANFDGSYTVKEGETLSFVSATDLAGNKYDSSDVTVLFFEKGSTATSIDADTSENLVNGGAAMNGLPGGMPTTHGDYWVVVFKGDVTKSGKPYDFADNTTLRNGIKPAGNDTYVSFLLHVEKDVTQLSDVSAFEFNGQASDEGMSDTDFMYTGGTLKAAFEVNGKKLVQGDNYTVSWITKPNGAATPTWNSTDECYELSNAQAGTYTARLVGTGSYAGTATVTIEVKPVDLSNASIYIKTTDYTTGLTFDSTQGGKLADESVIVVNGTPLDSTSDVYADVISVESNSSISIGSLTGKQTSNGKYTFRLLPGGSGGNTTNVTGSAVVDAYIVQNKVVYCYDGVDVTTASFNKTFNASLGRIFTTDALAASAGSSEVKFTSTVTKDGQAVSSFTEPGTYKLVLDTPVVKDAAGNYAYAGHEELTFAVVTTDYSGSKIYASYDGKSLSNTASGVNAKVEYTGKAIEPTVVVRDKKNNVLTEGTDYTWKLVDKDGNEVESATNPGTYTIEVAYAAPVTGTAPETKLSFEITKATIESVAPTADFFAIPEEGAAAPSFVGYTEPGLKGLEFALDADRISVRYYEAELDADGDVDFTNSTTPVKAENLTEEGIYVARINVLTSDETLQGADLEVAFELSKTAAFVDVNANAWYAQAVADAYTQMYINGIGGTNVFMPEADITRADAVGIIYNMAGGHADDDFHFDETGGYVTGFSDVDGHAYYAKAIAWAKAAGVVNGHGGAFNPDAKITRQEFAAMLSNYAKATGNYDAPSADALSGIADAGSVDAWAVEAVSWAVENGVMGNGGYVWGRDNISRAQVAAMAVNYQPENLTGVTR